MKNERHEETEFVILMSDWGDGELSDEDLAALEIVLGAEEYRPGWDEEEGPAEWTVRRPQRGEAEGNYYRKPGGDLQIMGYSIDEPDGLSEHINQALDRLYTGPIYTLAVDDDPAEMVDMEGFLADNADTFEPDDVAELRGLKPGQEVVGGGGAAPVWTFRRMS